MAERIKKYISPKHKNITIPSARLHGKDVLIAVAVLATVVIVLTVTVVIVYNVMETNVDIVVFGDEGQE